MSSTADVFRGSAALLAGLPGMGPRRLSVLLDAWDPPEAWARATSGRPDQLVTATGSSVLDGTTGNPGALAAQWKAAGSGADPAAAASMHQSVGVQVLLRHDAAYPDVLRADIEPPAVLFAQGDLGALDRPRVAVVGTRRCTGAGAGLARELGQHLAAAGVGIVSGLAIGIDGAAHRGVLDERDHPGAAPPIGVVGSGFDVIYPPRHARLWQEVADIGLLLGEAPLGARPAAWRFPARNRVIAALADLVIVVESHARGGSLHTVTEAERRDIQVLAAPGSVRNPAAAGTNQLLAEGCHPVRDATDVLVALGLSSAARRTPSDRRPPPGPDGVRVLDAFSWEPATLEHLAVRTNLDLPTLAVTVEALVSSGWVTVESGWYERVGA